MKVKFLRNYGDNKIGTIEEITIDEKEKKYLLTTNTIEILEEDEPIEEIPVVEPVEEIPVVEPQQKSKKSKKEATNE